MKNAEDKNAFLNIYLEEYATEYHKLAKLFLFYLHTFIYNSPYKEYSFLDDGMVIRLENFIALDTTQFRDPEYAYILNVEVKKQKMLRVDGYIVYNIKAFLARVEKICASLEKSREMNGIATMNQMVVRHTISNEFSTEIRKIREDNELLDAIFGNKNMQFVKEENKKYIAMLFFGYLENCVYFKKNENISSTLQNFIEKAENIVVLHLPSNMELSKRQKKTFAIAVEHMATRVGDYVKTRFPVLKKMLTDFDALQEFETSNKIRLIEKEEDVSYLPTKYSKEEIEAEFKVFLSFVFMTHLGTLKKGSCEKRIPIFYSGLEEPRNQALELALEYLNRFVYSVSRDFQYNETFVVCLENYIDFYSDFKVEDSSLCQAKAILYTRTGLRNTISDEKQARKILKRQ